ncbi:hypothetical protein GWK47_001277 [Chionoecetes opilio]|uniref:Uncharacterized protein n=1 Tax=Chionoecetes opilio TaxID=41210 RepID=A0A8J4Y2N1_CHIOP|nr:hypothetical protein GWK47_001277 [Chionoecetes opilio]
MRILWPPKCPPNWLWLPRVERRVVAGGAQIVSLSLSTPPATTRLSPPLHTRVERRVVAGGAQIVSLSLSTPPATTRLSPPLHTVPVLRVFAWSILVVSARPQTKSRHGRVAKLDLGGAILVPKGPSRSPKPPGEVQGITPQHTTVAASSGAPTPQEQFLSQEVPRASQRHTVPPQAHHSTGRLVQAPHTLPQGLHRGGRLVTAPQCHGERDVALPYTATTHSWNSPFVTFTGSSNHRELPLSLAYLTLR